jgi:CO/xanthine dehydrogenase Mo-binding subunit
VTTDKHPGYKHLGQPRKIIDGLEKITGTARYTADVQLPGMLHARPVLSPYAHARVVSINADAARAVPGVVAVLNANDLVTKDRVINSRSSAVLAHDTVVFAGEFVAVVVGQTEQAAADGAALVDIEYEPLPVVSDPLEAMQPDAHVIWPRGVPKEGADLTSLHGNTDDGGPTQAGSNIHDQKVFERGNLQAGMRQASVIVERTYTNAWVHQGYLEPHAVVAEPGRKHNELTIYTSTQGQFAVRDETARLLGLRNRDITVVPMVVGGGFGAKYGLIEPLTGALALKLGKPVKLVLTRTEDMQTTTPSPGTHIELKTGASQDGRITALEARVIVDNGVFPFSFSGILAQLLGGYYRIPNLRMEVVNVLTHKPQSGAYRAPGAPQVTFAIESNVDEMARVLKMDALEFRLLNAVEGGDPHGLNRPWPSIGLRACLERLRDHPAWKNRTHNRGGSSHALEPDEREGVGIALGGWPGAFSPAGAICRVDTDGTVRLQIGNVDISGVNSSLVLIVAEHLGVDPDSIEIVQGDTASGPFAPASGGSQVTVSVSGAVTDAAEQVRDQLLHLASLELEAHKDDLELRDGAAQVKGVPERSIPIGQLARMAQRKAGGPGPVVAEGRAAMKSGAPGFAVHLVRLAVSTDTGRIRPLEYVAVQDVGFALNPMLIEGQMHGGAAQGLGFGLFEAMRFDDSGNLMTANFLEYAFPRAEDLPPLEAVLVQQPSESGPYGARIVGEPPIIEGGAAVANAIFDAVGVRVTALPVQPEMLWKLMQSRD